ncbi:MAG: DUF805 domain-containing protein [Prevotellaceae bacterium]|jgi:uncharacterized membrane protein YhaH (DUF805 family)|nr:DUF805 domain-containing protein [Prevotellaceae bacterium]
MDWYFKVLKQYADFSGRAGRTEYWMFIVCNVFFLGITMILDKLTFETLPPYFVFCTLYALAVLIPGIAVVVRRLHDIGKSGWWCFIILVPLVGIIWFLVLMVTDSQAGDNAYGVNPKAEADEFKLLSRSK